MYWQLLFYLNFPSTTFCSFLISIITSLSLLISKWLSNSFFVAVKSLAFLTLIAFTYINTIELMEKHYKFKIRFIGGPKEFFLKTVNLTSFAFLESVRRILRKNLTDFLSLKFVFFFLYHLLINEISSMPATLIQCWQWLLVIQANLNVILFNSKYSVKYELLRLNTFYNPAEGPSALN